MVTRSLLVITLVAATVQITAAQQPDYVLRSYKQLGADSLVVHVFTPTGAGVHPAVVLFHGGGFVWGGPEITDGSAREYAARGLVAFSAQYRLANRSTVTPIEQVEDARDVIRWVRTHAAELGVDPDRIIAHGVSAGGFLAAMAAASADDVSRPNALVLWSPGVGTGDNDPYFRSLFGSRARPVDLTPMRSARTTMPPAIIISGALDSVTFDNDARLYCAKLREANARCDFHSYPNLGHLLTRRLDARSQQQGQFDWDPIATRDAEEKIVAFLRSLGYLAR